MRRVFLDTVGLVALWDKRDQWHAESVAAFERLSADGAVTITTDSVLLECGNALSRTNMRQAIILMRRKLIADQRLVIPDKEEFENAWREYEFRTNGEAGIVDIISFQVMRRLGVSEAFTNDQHFKAAGFTTLF